jgi:hypothetical protein
MREESRIWKPGDTVRFIHDARGESHWGFITGHPFRDQFGSIRQMARWRQTNSETPWDPIFYRSPDDPVEEDPVTFRSYGPFGELMEFTFVGRHDSEGYPMFNQIKVPTTTQLTRREKVQLRKLRDLHERRR